MSRILAIGDIIGRPGRRALVELLPYLRKKYEPDIVLVNGENAAGGFGLTKKIYLQLIDELGVDAVTMGNHWHDKKEIFNFFEKAERLVLPANMGNVKEERFGARVITSHKGTKFGVINLIGKAFMHEGNRSPFDACSRLLPRIQNETPLRIVDMHAEATSEKQGMGYFLRGRVSLVYGTHSHVATADERIISDHTGFQTDLGATGGYDSIIGMKADAALKRMLTGEKVKLEPAKDNIWLCGLIADCDDQSGACQRVERLRYELNSMDL